MIRRMDQAKRLISYILFYAMLCSVMEPGATGTALAAAIQRGNRTAINYLQPGKVSTEAGITVNGRNVRLETYGSRFFVIDKELEDGFAIITTEAGVVTTGSVINEPAIITTGAGLVSSGTAISLTAGLSEKFEITDPEAPALFSFRTAKLAGNCRQFRIITEASGFEVWLLDRDLQPVTVSAGVGGSDILRYALEDYNSYYLLVCGDAGTSGKLMYSDIIDDYGADFSTAGDLAFNRDYIIETEVAGDVDVLTFCASSAVSTYQMNIQSVSGSGGTFEVFDQNWRKLDEYSGTMDKGRLDKTFTPETGKRYYFRFTSEQTGRKILLHISQDVVRYRITYHLHGGKNDKSNPTSYISTTSKIRLKKATRSKYLFDGWYTDTTYRSKVSSIKGANQRNMDLHAKWKKVSPAKTHITHLKLKNKKNKKIVVKWKKAKDIKGYQLVYGTTRGLNKKVKKKTTKKTSLTIRGLKTGKTYYFKVRCYSKDSKGKKVYGKYSKVKKIKLKDKKKKAAKNTKKTATVKKKGTKNTKKTAAAKKKTAKNSTKKTTKTAAAKKKTTKKSTKTTTATKKSAKKTKTTATTKKKK